MPPIWFKIAHTELSEIRVFSLYYNRAFDENFYAQLENETRNVFDLDDDYEFHYIFKDRYGDDITIKKNYELMNCLAMERHTQMKLTIVSALNYEQRNTSCMQDNNSQLTESLQSIMKNLELGINKLQASVEKSAASTVESAVKTAAETAAHLYRSLLPDSNISEKPKFDVICDGCYSPIRGQRYHCETCEDYDLCSVCKSRVNHNPEHNFRHIKKESLNIPKSKTTEHHPEPQHQPFTQSHLHFICDYCDSDIVGIRHTCGACPDFDLCHSCFAIVKENHPEQHVFVTYLVGTQVTRSYASVRSAKSKKQDSKPIYETSLSSADSSIPTEVQHLGVECDHCDSPIEGVRFKCGHCSNFDLCETCEEHAPSIHDREHAFIKIRYPIQSIVKRHLLPKFKTLSEKNTAKPQSESAQEMVSNSSIRNTPYEIISKPEEVITIRSNSSSATSSTTSAPLPSTSLPIVEPEPEPKISATFISDLNIPDGTVIVPKKTFIKMWKIKNTGNVDWPIGSHLLFNGGSILRPYPISRPDCFAIPVISPDEETCVTAELQAPDSPGEYTSYFCLCTPDGDRFGDNLWCSIKVNEDLEPEKNKETSFATPSPPVSAASIMMNSSTTMIFPTISTSSSMNNIKDQQQQQVENPFESDSFSETTTGDHASTMTSHTTRTYTNSQVSSPSPSELDIGERIDSTFYMDELQLPHQYSQGQNEENADHSYQVISPAVSIIEEKSVSKVDDDDEFVIVSEDEDDYHVELSMEHSINSSSMHSAQTAIQNSPQHALNDADTYRTQLVQLHEMGFTSYDDLALSLLRLHDGQLDVVVSKLVEYP